MSAIEKQAVAETQVKSQLRLHRIYIKSSLFEASTVTPALLENLPQPVIYGFLPKRIIKKKILMKSF